MKTVQPAPDERLTLLKIVYIWNRQMPQQHRSNFWEDSTAVSTDKTATRQVTDQMVEYSIVGRTGRKWVSWIQKESEVWTAAHGESKKKTSRKKEAAAGNTLALRLDSSHSRNCANLMMLVKVMTTAGDPEGLCRELQQWRGATDGQVWTG